MQRYLQFEPFPKILQAPDRLVAIVQILQSLLLLLLSCSVLVGRNNIMTLKTIQGPQDLSSDVVMKILDGAVAESWNGTTQQHRLVIVPERGMIDAMETYPGLCLYSLPNHLVL